MTLSRFDVLPHEIVVKILALIPFGSGQCHTLALVCQKFHSIVSSGTFRMELARYQCPELLALRRRTTIGTMLLKISMSEENEAVSLAASLTKDSDNEIVRRILLEGARLLIFVCLNLEGLDLCFAPHHLSAGDPSPYRHTFMLIARGVNPCFWGTVCKALRFTIWRFFDAVAGFQDDMLEQSTIPFKEYVEAQDRLSGEESQALSNMFIRRSFEISILSMYIRRLAVDAIKFQKAHFLVELTRDIMDIFQELLETGMNVRGFDEVSYVACLQYLQKLPIWLEIGECSPSTNELAAFEDNRIRDFFAAELAKDRKLETDITNAPKQLLDDINKVDLTALARFLKKCLTGTVFVHGKLDKLPIDLFEEPEGGFDMETFRAMSREVEQNK